MKFITFRDYKIAYKTVGEGNPVLWLHGFCEDSRMWESFTAPFDDKQHIFIDMPGLGQSDVIADLSIDLITDIIHAVLEQLNIRKFIFIGHSMGGYVALAFAKKYPQFLEGLGLFHTHPYADSEEKKGGRNKAISFIEKHGHVLYVKQLIPVLFGDSFTKSNAFLIEKMTRQAVEYSGEGIVASLKAMRDRADNSDVLKTLNCPVLFIVGQKDKAIPETYSMEQLYLPTVADIHVFPKVAHMGMFEITKKTQRIVHQFCSFCKESIPI